jgi:hypothetical protein
MVKGWRAESLRQARRAATVELVPVELLAGEGETAAFEVSINGVIDGDGFGRKAKAAKSLGRTALVFARSESRTAATIPTGSLPLFAR